jgi:hypothetical protein
MTFAQIEAEGVDAWLASRQAAVADIGAIAKLITTNADAARREADSDFP